MSNNQITDVGIVYQSYNSRGLITHRANTSALIRQSNGTLWAAVREDLPAAWINIYHSLDNGFSWQRVIQTSFTPDNFRKVGVTGLNANGPFMQLCVFEKYDRLVLVCSYLDNSNGQYNTEWFVYQMSTMTRLDGRASSPDMTVPPLNTISNQGDELSMQVPYNENVMFLVWVGGGHLFINAYKAMYQHAEEQAVETSLDHLINVFGTVCDEKGNLDVAVVHNKLATSNYEILHYRYHHNSGVIDPPVVIFSCVGRPIIMNLNIARDGSGTQIASWGQQTIDGTDVDLYNSISTDNGLSWTAPLVVPKSAGHSVYIDPATGERDTLNSLIGGTSGFLISYVRRNGSGIGKTFVRTITTVDNQSYGVNAEQQIAQATSNAEDPIVGLRFFRPPSSKLLNLSEPGYVRVAYQRGEGASTTQTDSKPVYFGQELLSQSAYPALLASESGSYNNDSPTSNDLPVSFNIIGAPNANVDYNALGYTGKITERYKNAFHRLGSDIRLLKFDPILNSHMDDRMAYGPPTEYTSRVFIDTLTYDDPTDLNVGLDLFTEVTERDIRKVYFGPDFHLDRTYLLNKGNYFKRTVWLFNFDGNDYEVSQVVPFILLDQIVYYSANAYVVGVNRDPFRRRVLPSET